MAAHALDLVTQENVPGTIFRKTVAAARARVTQLSRALRQEDALTLLTAINIAEGQVLVAGERSQSHEEMLGRIRQATIMLRQQVNAVALDEPAPTVAREEDPPRLTLVPSREPEPVVAAEPAAPAVADEPAPLVEPAKDALSEWLTAEEAMALTGVTRRTIDIKVEQGEIVKGAFEVRGVSGSEKVKVTLGGPFTQPRKPVLPGMEDERASSLSERQRIHERLRLWWMEHPGDAAPDGEREP